MNRSNVIKVIGAFAAGVLITMGSLIYSRNQELNHFRKAVQSSLPVKPAIPAEISLPIKQEVPRDADRMLSASPENAKLSTGPVRKIEAAKERARPVEARKLRAPKPTVPAQVPQIDEPARRRSEIAQSTRVPNLAAQADSAISARPKFAPPPSISVPVQTQPPNTAEATPGPRRPNVVTLQPGTSFTVRLQESLSTERNRTGDKFLGTLDSPLIVNGFVLADRGATVAGRITNLKRARLLGGKSDLCLILTEIATSDGQRVHIETSPWEQKSAHNSIADTPRIAGGAALGAVVGALTGAAKGAGLVSANDARTGTHNSVPVNNRDVSLGTGVQLAFRLAKPVMITEKLN